MRQCNSTEAEKQ